ncbi:MAG: hypothetical protein AAFV53_26500 [Myxococcota bacterium]
MSSDPRRILQDAASLRTSCEILSRSGDCTRGQFVRTERGGVVVTVPERRFVGGEDVRVWFSMDGQPYTFEASVIRRGVPVPDRTQDGLLVGFIDRWQAGAAGAAAEGRFVEVLPPSGPPISLLRSPSRLVDVTLTGVSFVVPLAFKMVFVESGALVLRLGIPQTPPEEVTARVRALAQGEDYLLYHLEIEQVADPDLHRVIIDGLSRTDL